ncbi:MAG: DUF3108 domain-containing protein [Glaciimonas sp.]|nr:DUF3108 domain-containing protein [Glaciimonas sp.]
MTMVSKPLIRAVHSAQPNLKTSRGWLILLVISLFLHIILLNWGSSKVGTPKEIFQKPATIIAELMPLPPVAKPTFAPQPVKPKPALAPRKIARKTASPPLQEPEVQDTPIRETRTPIIPTGAFTILDLNTTENLDPIISGNNSASIPALEAVSAAPVVPNTVHYEINPPPSAELTYAVEALRKGQTFHGSGKITWQTDSNNYIIKGEAGILFISALNFKSEGEINGFGVAPVLYTEKKFRKSATNTYFQRERNTITFSTSMNSYPRTGGEQDRASIVWQLASIARGDAGKIIPGGIIDLFVAGDRDAETWRFQVVGQEQTTTGTGTFTTWHLVRKPQEGSYEKTLDIWLSPQQEWYPVRLRFTEKNSDYLDMSLSNLEQLNAVTTPG